MYSKEQRKMQHVPGGAVPVPGSVDDGPWGVPPFIVFGAPTVREPMCLWICRISSSLTKPYTTNNTVSVSRFDTKLDREGEGGKGMANTQLWRAGSFEIPQIAPRGHQIAPVPLG